MQRVKIVATLGPASDTPSMIGDLIEAGVDTFRLNFSHGTHDDHRRIFDIVRAQAASADAQIAVLADLCGPKIRIGEVVGDGILLEQGAEISITTESMLGTCDQISTSYESLPTDVKKTDRILVDDGLLELEVVSVQGKEVNCRVIVGGVLKSRKGMNIPGTALSTPALTEKDKKDLLFARELGVDYFALSFVRRAEDVREAKALAGTIPVISKIEKPEAIEALKEIIDASDGVMVARGDLGVEAGAEVVPILQKRIIRETASVGKPVIVATQMLDSMIRNPRPTRAEVSDVANAVLDGADAVMLSGETASGEYPLQAAREMAAIISEVEKSALFEQTSQPVRLNEYSFSNAIARAAVTAAEDLSLKALAVYSETGHSPALVSACRPKATVVALSRHETVLRRLALRWGITPVKAEWVEGVRGVVEQAADILLRSKIVQPGDDIAVTFGMQDMSGPGRTDVLKLWRVTGSQQ